MVERKDAHIYTPQISNSLQQEAKLGQRIGHFRLRIDDETQDVSFGHFFPSIKILRNKLGDKIREMEGRTNPENFGYDPLKRKGILKEVHRYLLEPLIQENKGAYRFSFFGDETEVAPTMKKIFEDHDIDTDKLIGGEYTLKEYYDLMMRKKNGNK